MNIAKFLINKKIAKNEKQAQYIMIGIIAACFLLIILNLRPDSRPTEEVIILPADDPAFINPDEGIISE